jgi:HlyD family secretion protein
MAANSERPSLVQESRRASGGRRLLPLVVAAAVVGGAFYYGMRNRQPAIEAPAMQEYTVKKGDVVLSVAATGSIVPTTDTELFFEETGKLARMAVKPGDTVKVGQLIAMQDDRAATLGLKQAEVKLKTAEAALQAKAESAPAEEIALQEELVRTAELNHQAATVDLRHVQDEMATLDARSDEDYRKILNLAVVKMSVAGDPAREALAVINGIFGIDSDSDYGSNTEMFGNQNSQYRSDAISNYQKAMTSYGAWLAKLNEQKQAIKPETVRTLVDEGIAALKDVNRAVQASLNAVSATSSSNTLSVQTLDGLRNSLQTSQERLKAQVLALTSVGSDLDDQLIDTADKRVSLTKEIEGLQVKVAAADQAIKVAKAQLSLKGVAVSAATLAPYRAQIAEARLDVSQAQVKLEALKITAPISGRVTAINFSVGQIVGADHAVPVVVISNANGFVVETYIEEVDVAKISEGQTVMVTFDAVEGLKLEGRVSRVADLATTDANGVVSYAVIVAVESTDARIRSGMTAYLDIASQGVRDVLVVPVAAVRSRDGKPAVTLKDGTAVQVTTGFTDGKNVEVMKGLKSGDVIVYAP